MLNKLLYILGFTPFIFLFAVWLFYILVKLDLGYFPKYGDPDPKQYFAFYLVVMVTMMLVPLAFFYWIVMLVCLIINFELKKYKNPLILAFVGFFFICILITFDPMGILNWFFD